MVDTETGRTSPSTKRKHGAYDSDNDAESATPISQDGPSKRTRTIGPAMPPPNMIPQASDGSSDNDSDSDDDDYGPNLPPLAGAATPSATTVQDTSTTHHPSSKAEDGASKRDDWMLRPPDELDFGSRAVDPTKLRNRKFNTAPSRPGASSGPSKMWTETPDEKRKRLENEVMGIQAPTTVEKPKLKGPEVSTAMSKQVQEYNEKTRNKSLYAQHRGKKEDLEKDDPSARPFDKEKDIRAPSKITNAQRREMMNKASKFSSRFSGGSFL